MVCIDFEGLTHIYGDSNLSGAPVGEIRWKSINLLRKCMHFPCKSTGTVTKSTKFAPERLETWQLVGISPKFVRIGFRDISMESAKGFMIFEFLPPPWLPPPRRNRGKSRFWTKFGLRAQKSSQPALQIDTLKKYFSKKILFFRKESLKSIKYPNMNE